MLGDYAGYKAGEIKLTPAQSLEARPRGTGVFGL